MPDYLRLIGEHYYSPPVEAYVVTDGDPTDYNDIVWIDTPISQAALDALAASQDDTLESEIIARLSSITDGDVLRWDGNNFIPESALQIEKDNALVSEANVLNFEGDVTVTDEGTKTTINIAPTLAGLIADSAGAQLSLSTTLNVTSTSFVDIVFDTLDEENNAAIVDADVDLTHIDVIEGGLYLVGYSSTVTSGTNATSVALCIKEVSVTPTPIPGTDRVWADAETGNIAATAIVTLPDNARVELEVKKTGADTPILTKPTFFVVKMQGAKGDMGPGGGSVFGGDFAEDSSDSQSSTTSTSFQRKLRLTTPSLSAGNKYRIGWSYEWRLSSTSYDFMARVQLDDTTTVMDQDQEPKDGAAWHNVGGFVYKTGLSGTVDIDLDYKSENGAATAYIRKARLEIWRVS